MNNFYFWIQFFLGVILFVFAVINFGKSVRFSFADKLKVVLGKFTKNPLKGTILGTVFTALVQSSTATTVMTVGLVEAGIITFTNSLGIIFGANIGTTITTQLVAFRFTDLAIYILALGAILLLIKKKNINKYGRVIFFFGLIFLAIKIISGAVLSISDTQLIKDFISLLTGPISAIVFGFILSVMMQSSFIVSSLVILFAGENLLTFYQAMGIIIGTNIGTTITSIFVASTMGIEAKKAAMAHFLFNFLGALMFLPLFNFVYTNKDFLGSDIVHQIANFHVLFNISSTIIFLLLIEPFKNLVVNMVTNQN